MKLLLALFASAALAACGTMSQTASAQSNGGGASRDCFRSSEVTSYGLVDDHRARITAGHRDYYFTIAQSTRDLDWNHSISVRSISSFICAGNGLGVQLMGGDPPIPYQVTNIERAPPRSQQPPPPRPS
jgi:hypothetical protein